MKRIKITVAYDGTQYCGWQIQPRDLTVEQVLNERLSTFLKEEIRVIGASRTDAGVHALGNVAVFDTDSSIPPERICYALNTVLPEDIRIMDSREVTADFHPRYRDSQKTYQYHIQNRRFPDPTKARYAHLVTAPLDVEAMDRAGTYLVGTHDFTSFCASGTQAKSMVRTVTGLKVSTTAEPVRVYDLAWGIGQDITIEVRGTGFLYNMVRIIAGTLIRVGLGVYPPEHVEEILKARNRYAAGETAPAKGLFLKEILY